MSNWNRSDVIALISLMVSIVGVIIGVTIPEVRCFVGLESASCTSPQITQTSPNEPNQNDEQPKSSPSTITVEPPPSTPAEPDINLISKSTEVDYNPLRDLLEARKWKEADDETANAMLQAAGRGNEGWLRTEDIDNFSCEDLGIIDRLWLKSSQGKFGFSVQKEIYQNLGRTREYNRSVLNYFGTQVGWINLQGDWLKFSELTFNQNAPKGHLPAYNFVERYNRDQRDVIFIAFFQRFRMCGMLDMFRRTLALIDDSSLTQRLVTSSDFYQQRDRPTSYFYSSKPLISLRLGLYHYPSARSDSAVS